MVGDGPVRSRAVEQGCVTMLERLRQETSFGRLRQPSLVRRLAISLLLVGLTAAGPLLHRTYGGLAHWGVVVATAMGAWWIARDLARTDERHALIWIALIAVAMRVAILAEPPYLSSDVYRYVWDGRVQALGINPYRYIPEDPALSPLRDQAIFPFINRRDFAPTIYPPAAQMFFLVAAKLGDSELMMRIALVACEAVALVATSLLLGRLGRPQADLALAALHPLAVWEIAGNGHVDALMIAFATLALVAAATSRTILATVLATAGTLVKPVAILLLPVFWKPWSVRIPAAAAATVALLYAPYLSVGSKVFGFLGGYVAEEELSHGTGFRYLLILERLTGPLSAAPLVYIALGGITMAGLALAAGFRRDRSTTATVAWAGLLTTTFLVLLTPHYPWYYLALVPYLALHPWSWTLWLLTVGGLQTYQAIPGEWLPDYGDRQVVFHLAVLAALVRDAAAAPILFKRNLTGREG